MKELPKSKLLYFDSLLNDIIFFNFESELLSSDNLYYFKSENNRLKGLKNKYIKLKLIDIYYIRKSSPYHIAHGLEDDNRLLLFARFHVLGDYYTLENLKSTSQLKTFSRAIDDNNYFSLIPYINQLTHYDNGV